MKLQFITTFLSVTFIALSAGSSTSAADRTDSLKVQVYFRQGTTALDLNYHNNGISLDKLTKDVIAVKKDTSRSLTGLIIRSGTSPEGSVAHNMRISRERGKTLKDYLSSKLGNTVEQISVNAIGENWELLKSLVEKSDCPDKAQVMEIMGRYGNYTSGIHEKWQKGSPKKELMDLNGGNTWLWLYDNIFPELRSSSNTVICHFADSPEKESPASDAETGNKAKENAIPYSFNEESTAVVSPVTEEAVSAKEEEAVSVNKEPEFVRRPLFAVKTNMLFDLATAVNVGVEIPIGKRFSLEGEWMFPDWVDRDKNSFCLQTNIKSAEFRLWLGKRDNRDKLTGHFLGVYGQYGDFDFQPFTSTGYRCYNAWAAGISYGFAHPINKAGTLRLEYSLGAGYVKGDYCKYMVESDGTKLVSKEDWHYKSSIFPVPTKAKVSLVWMINYKKKVVE